MDKKQMVEDLSRISADIAINEQNFMVAMSRYKEINLIYEVAQSFENLNEGAILSPLPLDFSKPFNIVSFMCNEYYQKFDYIIFENDEISVQAVRDSKEKYKISFIFHSKGDNA